MAFLDTTTFKSVLENAPLFSIDLVLMNPEQEVLLGYRKNPPAQGHWFVPGGRVFKNEALQDAFKRICLDELALGFSMSDGIPLGIYDHFYDDSIFGEGTSTHYINAPYLLRVENEPASLPHSQHDDYRWVHIDELERDPAVHKYACVFLPLLRDLLNKATD